MITAAQPSRSCSQQSVPVAGVDQIGRAVKLVGRIEHVTAIPRRRRTQRLADPPGVGDVTSEMLRPPTCATPSFHSESVSWPDADWRWIAVRHQVRRSPRLVRSTGWQVALAGGQEGDGLRYSSE